MPQKLLLVDTCSFFYRFYHARRGEVGPNGEFIGAILGTIGALRALIENKRPTRIAMVFDAPGRTFREDIYPQYKANREEKPPEVRESIRQLFDLLDIHGYPVLSMKGVEADDVIGTLACRAASGGDRVLIASDDKDLAQLVSGQIALFRPQKNERMDERAVREHFGVKPSQFADYLALIGDKSDNIPGVEGVGAKTAAKWLNHYGTMEELMRSKDEIGGKVGHHLREAVKNGLLDMCRSLARIKTDCRVPIDIEHLVRSAILEADLDGYAKSQGVDRALLEMPVHNPSEHRGNTHPLHMPINAL